MHQVPELSPAAIASGDDAPVARRARRAIDCGGAARCVGAASTIGRPGIVPSSAPRSVVLDRT